MLQPLILMTFIFLNYAGALEATAFQRLESMIIGLQQKYEDLKQHHQSDIAVRDAVISELEKRVLTLEKVACDRTVKEQHDTSSGFLKNILTSEKGTSMDDHSTSDRAKNVNTSSLVNQIKGPIRNIRKTNKIATSHGIKQRGVPEIVAFYAYLSASESDPGRHHTLIFDVIQTNIGNSYSKHTGIFTVPISGVYFFTWTVADYCHSYVATELVVNSNARGFIETNDSADCTYEVATGNSVLDLTASDVVYVRTSTIYGEVGAITSVSQIRTSFAGFLIFGH